MEPLVSVIIPTKEEEKYIENTLKAIRNQNYSNIEIIVSDGCSADNTVKIAKKYADKIITNKKIIASSGKNLGARYAKGDILVFVDADTLLSHNWIENAVNLFENKDIIATYGRSEPLEKSIKAKFFSELTNFILHASSAINFRQLTIFVIWGGNILAVRKRIFNKVGRFNERLVLSEDKEIVKKLMHVGKVVFSPKNISYVSFRRLEKDGYLKWYFRWTVSSILFLVLKKSYINYYKPIR